MAGGGGEGEDFLCDVELPVACWYGVGIEELEKSAGGEFGWGGAGECGEGVKFGVGGAALLPPERNAPRNEAQDDGDGERDEEDLRDKDAKPPEHEDEQKEDE